MAGLASTGVKIVPLGAGVSGNTSREMLARIDGIIARKPDWMTLSCGVNDVWHGPTGCDLETYKKNITAIVDKVQAANIKIVILTATPINENDNANNQKLVAYNDFLRGLAKERNYPLADLNAAFWEKLKAVPHEPGTNLLTVDGVHMNAEGNILMARGTMAAFGMSPSEIDRYEATWRASDDAAALVAGLQFNSTVAVSLTTLGNVETTAATRKMRPADLINNLYFQAICKVAKKHENDPVATLVQLKPEIDQTFSDLAKGLSPLPTSAASSTEAIPAKK